MKNLDTGYITKFVDHLGKSLLDDLKTEIPKHLEHFVEERFKGIRTALEPLDRIETDIREQGKDIEDLKIAYKKMEVDLQAMRENYQKLPNKIADKIDTAMEQGQSQIEDVITGQLEQIPTKPSKPTKKKFWFF
jgi:predicted  nucleic acid-binding Zn-ribbon protein